MLWENVLNREISSIEDLLESFYKTYLTVLCEFVNRKDLEF